MTNKLKLILPNRKYAKSFLKMRKEYEMDRKQNGRLAASRGASIFKSLNDFPAYKKRMDNDAKGIDLEKGRVPATYYWALVGNTVVGGLDVRHKLSKVLKSAGGHIGYGVGPSFRKKGYATEMLRLGLQKAKKIGIKKVLVTCDETNVASRRVIEKNGGILENKVIKEGIPKLRFWIKIK